MTATETRRWSFPDEIDRVLKYPRAVWRTFDWLRDEHGWTDSKFAALAYRMALEYAPRSSERFEAEIHDCLKLLIRNMYLTYHPDDPRNDN